MAFIYKYYLNNKVLAANRLFSTEHIYFENYTYGSH